MSKKWTGLRTLTLLVIALAGSTVSDARGGSVSDYAIFGGRAVQLNVGARIDGLVASNGDVSAVGSTVAGLQGGGSLLTGNLGTRVTGGITFGGAVETGAGSQVGGPINAGGDVAVRFASQTGAITAAGDVTMESSTTVTGNVALGGDFANESGNVINGSVAAGGSATVNGRVNGNVTYGTTATVGPVGRVAGTLAAGATTVNPAPYVPTSIPTPSGFAASGAAVIAGNTAASPLAPGSYGAVNITGPFQSLYLTAGDYFFTSFRFESSTINLVNIALNRGINIHVTGDYIEGNGITTNINGRVISGQNAALGAVVRIETLGNFTRGDGASGIGTIFAPNGDVRFGDLNRHVGQVIAGGRVDAGLGFTQTFVASAAVPEPGALVLTMSGIAIAAGFARFRCGSFA